MRLRPFAWLGAAFLALALSAEPVSAGTEGSTTAEQRLVSMGYTSQEAHAKLDGLSDDEKALVAEDPSLIQVGGIDTKQGAMMVAVGLAFFLLIFLVY